MCISSQKTLLLAFFLIILLWVLLGIGEIFQFGGLVSLKVWAESENNDQADPIPEDGEGMIDSVHRAISKSVPVTADWLDSFFDDERIEESEFEPDHRPSNTWVYDTENLFSSISGTFD